MINWFNQFSKFVPNWQSKTDSPSVFHVKDVRLKQPTTPNFVSRKGRVCPSFILILKTRHFSYLLILIAFQHLPTIISTSYVLTADKVDTMPFNVNTFFKWVPSSKSRVKYDLDTDLDTRHRHHNTQIIGIVGSPLYLATPVYTTDMYKNS